MHDIVSLATVIHCSQANLAPWLIMNNKEEG